MRLKIRALALVVAAAAAAAFAASGASAASCIGSCGASGANGVVTAPPGSSTYGWVSTNGGSTGVGQIASVNGVGSERATNGSTFTTTAFTVSTPQALNYYFNYVTSDGQQSNYVFQDYAFAQLVDLTNNTSVMLFNSRTEPGGSTGPGLGLPAIGPGVTLTALGGWTDSSAAGGPSWAPLGPSSGTCYGPGCGYTGWWQSSYTISAPGAYQLVFGVTNWADTAYDSGLAFSGPQVPSTIASGVPEPATWATMLLGVGCIGAGLRTRRKAAMIAA